MLLAALPLIARAMGGVALAASRDGVCLGAAAPDGAEGAAVDGRLLGSLLELCTQAAAQGRPLELLCAETGARCFAVPVDGVVLAASDNERVSRQARLFQALKETLPSIAEVAGGEAVLFDAGGRRLYTADPNSRALREGPGTVIDSCVEAMATGRPHIGPSPTVAGSTAVRIPLSSAFGFGFNNAYSIRQREKLLNEVQKRRTAKYTWDDIICGGPRLTVPLKIAQSAAHSKSPVIIFGESGTGKELFAQAIHNASSRSDRPFVAINCSALPESLIESTFFGYVEGAFTGARRGGQAGLFEQANHGTLLLDEISEAPLELQAKLLRVLQEHEVRRVGADRATPVDVRIIATCNRDLLRCMDEGRFRSDLYYRLNVIDIYISPLRQGKEDIPSLLRAMLEKLARADGVAVPDIEQSAMNCLMDYDWPGNVRELRNVMERVISLSPGEKIGIAHLPAKIADGACREARPPLPPAPPQSAPRLPPAPQLQAAPPLSPAPLQPDPLLSSASPLPFAPPLPPAPHAMLAGRVADFERVLLFETLERCNGNREQTARALGISVSTLWRRLSKARA